RRLAAAANAAASEERFDLKLRALARRTAVPGERLVAGAEGAPVQALRGLEQAAGAVGRRAAAGSVTWGRWFADMVRLAVDALVRERAGRVFDTASSEESVLATRRAITRYARDMSFNVAVVAGMLLVFVAALARSR
ncbi:MAG: hypothetical protein QMD96_05970, partial [Anaerosomatales bacterium]|nr:hypothetical protein [Anaerosomatales bacterium]